MNGEGFGPGAVPGVGLPLSGDANEEKPVSADRNLVSHLQNACAHGMPVHKERIAAAEIFEKHVVACADETAVLSRHDGIVKYDVIGFVTTKGQSTPA